MNTPWAKSLAYEWSSHKSTTPHFTNKHTKQHQTNRNKQNKDKQRKNEQANKLHSKLAIKVVEQQKKTRDETRNDNNYWFALDRNDIIH